MAAWPPRRLVVVNIIARMRPQGKSTQFGVGGACSTTIFGGEGEIAAPWLPKLQPSAAFLHQPANRKRDLRSSPRAPLCPKLRGSTCASRVGFGVSPKQSLLALRGAWAASPQLLAACRQHPTRMYQVMFPR